MGLRAHSKKHMDLGRLHSYVDDNQAETLAVTLFFCRAKPGAPFSLRAQLAVLPNLGRKPLDHSICGTVSMTLFGQGAKPAATAILEQSLWTCLTREPNQKPLVVMGPILQPLEGIEPHQ